MKEIQWKRGPKPYQIQYGKWKEFMNCMPYEISFLRTHKLLWYSEMEKGVKILFADESKDEPFNELTEIYIMDTADVKEIQRWAGAIIKRQWKELMDVV